MTTEIQQLMDDYTSWLRAKISLRKVDDWVEITTPYLDRHNDYLQIYARRENGSYMLAINDLFYLAQPNVASLFLEDFLAWLEQNYIRYIPNVKFAGKSGYDHLFDAVIPKSRQAPERVLQAINRPDKNEAQALAFSWMDTREVRKPESMAYAFMIS